MSPHVPLSQPHPSISVPILSLVPVPLSVCPHLCPHGCPVSPQLSQELAELQERRRDIGERWQDKLEWLQTGEDWGGHVSPVSPLCVPFMSPVPGSGAAPTQKVGGGSLCPVSL